MAELTGKAISELPAATTINDTDLLALSQNGASKKITPPVLLSSVEGEISGLSGSLATYVRPNLLDNWYFIRGVAQTGVASFPINQRGQNSYSGARYGIDRWVCGNVGSIVALGYNNYIVIKSSVSGGQNLFLQYFENKEMFAGKTVTISAIINGTLVSSTISVPADSSTWGSTIGDGSSAVGGCAVYLRYLSSKLCFVFYTTSNYVANTNILIQAAKIEIGDTQTLAHQVGNTWVLNEIPNYSDQLTRCKRYFERLTGEYDHIGTGFANNVTDAYVYIPIKEKAKAPTVTLSGSVYIWQPGKIGSSAPVSTSITDYSMASGKNILFLNMLASGLTASAPCGSQFRDAASYIDVSADL